MLFICVIFYTQNSISGISGNEVDVQTYLEQYDNARRKIAILHNEYEEEKKMIDSVLSSPYFDRKFRDTSVVKSKVYIRKLKDLEQQQQKICDEVRAFIERIPGIKGEILHERYINCDTWEHIADKLFYSVKSIYRLHKLALEELQNVLDQNETTK